MQNVLKSEKNKGLHNNYQKGAVLKNEPHIGRYYVVLPVNEGKFSSELPALPDLPKFLPAASTLPMDGTVSPLVIC